MTKDNGKAEIPLSVAQNPQVMALRIQALEDALEKLTEVFQTNMMFVRKGFAHTDGHLWVLKQLCVDMANGDEISRTTVKSEETGEDEEIVDLSPYYERYNAMMKKEAAAAMAAAKQTDEAPAEEPEEEFGGDVGDEQGTERSSDKAAGG